MKHPPEMAGVEFEWSQRRDLRTDAPPEQWGRPEGAGVPPNVDPRIGELRAA
jgi:hypothetical protein